MASVRPNRMEMRAVEQTRDDVATLIVGAEPVPFDTGAAAVRLVRPCRARACLLAHFVRQGPCRRRGRGRGQIEIVRRIGIADRRPDRPAVRFDFLLNEGVAIVGHGQKAPEFLLGIVDEHGKEQFALVGNDDRFVVGDEFGEQRDDEQNEKNPERNIAAPVATEIVEATTIDRLEFQPAAMFERRGERRA